MSKNNVSTSTETAAPVVQTIDVKKIEKLNKAILEGADLAAKLEKVRSEEAALRVELGAGFAIVTVKKGGGRPAGSKNKPKPAAAGQVEPSTNGVHEPALAG